MPVASGPSLAAPSPWIAAGQDIALISEEERALLTPLAELVDFRKGQMIYENGEDAGALFVMSAGVVKSYRAGIGGREIILAFWFMNDCFGLAETGKYVNSLRAVTAVKAYRIPVVAFEQLVREHPSLIASLRNRLLLVLVEGCNLVLLLHQLRSIERICCFLEILAVKQARRGLYLNEIHLPMTRRDISFYLGITPEVLSRSLRDLVERGIISFRDGQHVRIVNRVRFDAIVGALRQTRL